MKTDSIGGNNGFPLITTVAFFLSNIKHYLRSHIENEQPDLREQIVLEATMIISDKNCNSWKTNHEWDR